MNRTSIICVFIAVMGLSVVLLSGCQECCSPAQSNISSQNQDLQNQLAQKDAVIAQQEKEIATLQSKQEISQQQLEKSANMMMDAFKQAMNENKELKAKLASKK